MARRRAFFCVRKAWKISARDIADEMLVSAISNAANGLVQTAKANHAQRRASYDLSDTRRGRAVRHMSDDAYFRMLPRYVDEEAANNAGQHYGQMRVGMESESYASKTLENDKNGDIIKLSIHHIYLKEG